MSQRRHLRTPALDPDAVPERAGTSYPEPFRASVAGRLRRALGDAAGLTQFGINLVTLAPGAWSAQRHWHTHEDEFVYVLAGELTLVTDAGEQTLAPGQAAGFAAGVADGHHLVNRGDAAATYLEVGTRVADDEAHYPDIDLFCARGRVFTRKNGDPY